MRSLADGKIRWGFFPPTTTTDRTGRGIWLGGKAEVMDDSDDAASVGDDKVAEISRPRVRFEGETDQDTSESEAEETDSEESAGGGGGGFFSALQLEDQSWEEDESESDDQEELDVGTV
jgi:hypothetical protein